MKKLKALFHVDEMGKWKLTLKNINNFLNGAEDPDILVVANAVAVKGYLPDYELFETMEELNKKGVVFSACNNALKGNNVELKDIGEFIKIVPAGVIEIAEKQMEGYAYIRP